MIGRGSGLPWMKGAAGGTGGFVSLFEKGLIYWGIILLTGVPSVKQLYPILKWITRTRKEKFGISAIP